MAGIYKIGVVSRKTGLSPSTLRLWEDQYGLLAQHRTRGGTRIYSEADVERVLYVRHLVRERGIALRAIADILDEASSSLPYPLDRVAIENIYLREATNHSAVEEARRMARVQATVRSVVSRVALQVLLTARSFVDDTVQRLVDRETEPWGVKVSAVEINDIQLLTPSTEH